MSPHVQTGRRRPELLLLTAFAALTRFVGLFFPNAVVFDEVHFEKYSSGYLTGQYYFDVHPPLAKLLFGGAARLLGIPGQTLATAQPAPTLRLLSAIAGTLIIPLFWLMLRQLRASRRVAFLGTLFLACDNAFILQSRLILLDIFIVLFGVAAVNLYLAARTRAGAARWAFLSGAAVAAGLSASVKWTGLSALGLIMLAWFVEERPKLSRARVRLALEGLALVVLPVAAYVATFAVHFALLPKAGPGDAFMRPPFRATLVGDRWYSPTATRSLLDKVVDLNREMMESENMLRSATHPFASKWYTWPAMIRPMHYWSSTTAARGPAGDIYLLGNPVVWWGSLLGMIVLAVGYVARRERFRPYRNVLAFLEFAYVINLLPFIGIRRVMFLYHYFDGLLFSVALATFCLGILAGWMDDDGSPWRFTSRRSARLYWGLAALAVAGFLFFTPETYGWTVSYPFLKAHLWLSTWG